MHYVKGAQPSEKNLDKEKTGEINTCTFEEKKN